MHKKILLTKMMQFFNKNTALQIFKMMILPYFDYCDVIYHGTCSNDLERLQRLQNKCLKTCLGLHQLCGTKLVHSRAKCPELKHRRLGHIQNFMFSRQFKEGLLDNKEISTRSHDAPLFEVEFPHKESFKRSVHYSGAVAWNSLPVKVRLMDNFSAFKAHQNKMMNLTYAE